jgi:UDP-N-acetylglucosamine transferase subunit ALG13
MAGAGEVLPRLDDGWAVDVNPDYRAPLLFVTVGGDHHPFDRLMRWVEDWLVEEGTRVRCVVQSGPARPPVGAESSAYLDHQEVLALMAEARAVVSSGGPATLSEARRLGHRPVAVPRLASLDEVVDDHQRSFTSRLHNLGLVVQAETEVDFRLAVSAALDAPKIVPSANPAPSAAIARVGALIDTTSQLGSSRRRFRRVNGQDRQLSQHSPS